MHMDGAVTIGMVATLVIGLLTFLAKLQFDNILNGIKNNRAAIDNVSDEMGDKINNLEKKIYEDMGKTKQDIKKVENELSQLKADIPIVYVLREDFVRSLNNVDNKMNSIENKIDKILMK